MFTFSCLFFFDSCDVLCRCAVFPIFLLFFSSFLFIPFVLFNLHLNCIFLLDWHTKRRKPISFVKYLHGCMWKQLDFSMGF